MQHDKDTEEHPMLESLMSEPDLPSGTHQPQAEEQRKDVEGILQEEASKTSKRARGATLVRGVKRRRTAVIQWFKKKELAKSHYPADAFLIKETNFKFGATATRAEFVDKCVTAFLKKGFLPPLYEIVHGNNPRLYLDIEAEFSYKLDEATMFALISKVLNVASVELNKLKDIGGHISLSTNHRFKKRDVDGKEMWTLSAHAVFPTIAFESIAGMKYFVQELLNPELMKDDDLIWTKRGKKGLLSRTLVDVGV